MDKQYFSQRIGNAAALSLKDITTAFKAVHDNFDKRKYFTNLFGTKPYLNNGLIGNSFQTFCMRHIRRSIDPPFMSSFYSEVDLFDVIELLHEFINYPDNIPDGKQLAQREFRDEINIFLNQYSTGWELSQDGYIRETLQDGMRPLIDNTALYGDEANVDSLIRRAKELFLKRGSGVEDKKTAIREIGDSLEFVRNELKQFASKDESDIFQILNRFGIRHNTTSQQTGYNPEIYYPWMFYTFLATFDAFVKLKQAETEESETP